MSLEIFPKPFEFPKDLSKLSEAEKDKLHSDYIRHQEPQPGSIELSPSRVMLPESKEYQNAVAAKKNRQSGYNHAGHSVTSKIKFDPEKGFVVPDEDPGIINGLDISEADRQRLLSKRAKPVSDLEADRTRFASLSDIDQEVEDRFSDI